MPIFSILGRKNHKTGVTVIPETAVPQGLSVIKITAERQTSWPAGPVIVAILEFSKDGITWQPYLKGLKASGGDIIDEAGVTLQESRWETGIPYPELSTRKIRGTVEVLQNFRSKIDVEVI